MARAVTMWEFSWLLRRSGAQSEYAQLERVLDELVERGYDCVRIDAFPHLVAPDAAGRRSERFRVHPQPQHFLWGPHGDAVEVVDPAAEVAAFVAACRDRGVRVALSSWFNDDDEHRRLQVRTTEDLVRVWTAALQDLDARGLLDAVEYVDLCNEFPLDTWLPEAHARIFAPRAGTGGPEGAAPAGTVPAPRPVSEPSTGRVGWLWTPEQRADVESTYAGTSALRARWPRLRFTVSVSPVSPSLMDLDYSGLDLLEAHIWLAGNVPEFAALTTAAFAEHGYPGMYQRAVDSLDEVYWPEPGRWHLRLREEMERWAALAAGAGVPLWTTEGWSHIEIDDLTAPSGRSSWDYVRSVAEAAVPAALELGWEGVCTSNFAQPHFARHWAEVDWHRRMTDLIRAGGGAVPRR